MPRLSSLKSAKNLLKSLGALILLAIMTFAPPFATAQENKQTLKTPYTLYYEAYVKYGFWMPPQKDDFIVHVTEAWLGGVSLQYVASTPDGDWIATDSVVISNLDNCKMLDPWFDPSAKLQNETCLLWLSRNALLSLYAEEQATFLLDVTERKDAYITLNVKEVAYYPCLLNGKKTMLPALYLVSNRDDELLVWDNPQNPLVLQIESGNFSWKLQRIDSP